MDREEVIKWLKIMKANLNSFPEVSNAKKIEALAEAIRLLKNEQSKESTGSTTKNDLGVELIDRAELLKAMDTWDKFGYTARYGLERLDKDDKDFVPYVKYDDMVNCVKNMPPVTPQEPKTGHWIEVAKYSDGKHEIECSKCGSHIFDRGHANSYIVKEKYKYCPRCGAKMVKPHESEEV